MSTTVENIYDMVCYDLLEDSISGPGLSKGLVTEQEFLDYLGIVLMDFLAQTGMVWTIFTQQLQAGVSAYLSPDMMPDVFYVFQNAYIVEKITLFSTMIQGQWQRKPGPTKAYHEDGLPLNTLELVPAPNWNGTAFTPAVGPPPPFGTYGAFQPGSRNLTMVGVSLASQEMWTIGQTLDTIPDTFTPYLGFGVLEKIFTKDGEARDQQRALYCRSRYDEGIALGRSIVMEVIGEDKNEKS